MQRLFIILISIAITAFPLVSSAGVVPCSGEIVVDPATGKSSIKGLCGFCDLFLLVHNLFEFLAFKIAPALSVVVFLIGAFMLMFGGASEKMKTDGKNAIRGAIIGIVIILLSWVIINTIINVLAEAGGQGGGGNAGFPWPWYKPSC